MNVLSSSASLGLLVLLFQDGLLGSGAAADALELYQPMLLTSLAFGLSTDYAVFLLSRIKGFHDRGDTNVEAVSHVLQQLSFIQQLGIGAAVAVLIDATIIRGVLVPALMALLGRWNWWAPPPLRRLHERIERSAREMDEWYETPPVVR